MKGNLKESIKTKVKAKAEAVKEKLKGAKKCAALAAALGVAAALAGCASANPASRANESGVEDVSPVVKVVLENSSSNTVSIVLKNTIGDGVLASADSAGSTETQTATPTLSIPIRVDARYNDALAAANSTSKNVLGSLGDGLGAVLDMMVSKKTGTVNAKTKDGKDVVVSCENGQCSIRTDCAGGACAPSTACEGGSCAPASACTGSACKD